MRNCLIALPLFLNACALATAQFGPSEIVSAKIQDTEVDSARSAIVPAKEIRDL